MASVLIIEDSDLYSNMLEQVLDGLGHVSTTVNDGEAGLKLYLQGNYDLVLSDIYMSGMDGITFLKTLKAREPEAVVIMMTAYAKTEYAVNSFKHGALDFLKKPIDFNVLQKTIEGALKIRQANLERRGQVAAPGAEGGSGPAGEWYIGRHPKVRAVLKEISSRASTGAPILLEGAPGTGKRAFAEHLHRTSDHSAGPLVTVDLANHSEHDLWNGLIGDGNDPGEWLSAACGGTLVLRHIDALSLPVQGELVRAFQVHLKEFFLVCTTRADLGQRAEQGRFCEALIALICENDPVRLPSLTEVIDDLPALVAHFVKKAAHPHFDTADITFAEDALAVLRHYSWPRNMLELMGVVSSVVANTETKTITAAQIPYRLKKVEEWPGLKSILADQERKYARSVVRATGGDRGRACHILGITPAQLEGIEAGRRNTFQMSHEVGTARRGGGNTNVRRRNVPLVDDGGMMRFGVSTVLQNFGFEEQPSGGLDGVASFRADAQEVLAKLGASTPAPTSGNGNSNGLSNADNKAPGKGNASGGIGGDDAHGQTAAPGDPAPAPQIPPGPVGRLTRLDAGERILLLCGASEGEALVHYADCGALMLVEKPFQAKAVRQAVEALVAGESAG